MGLGCFSALGVPSLRSSFSQPWKAWVFIPILLVGKQMLWVAQEVEPKVIPGAFAPETVFLRHGPREGAGWRLSASWRLCCCSQLCVWPGRVSADGAASFWPHLHWRFGRSWLALLSYPEEITFFGRKWGKRIIWFQGAFSGRPTVSWMHES